VWVNIQKDNANLFYEKLKDLPGLNARRAYGAMYMMIGIDLDKFKDISSDLEFAQKLMREQSVFCFPATVMI
jgi:tyrosine aminotransferase